MNKNPSPIGDKEFAHAVADVCAGMPDEPVALAVSGGPDSMALLILMSRYVGNNGNPDVSISALTVDHNIRPEASEEAAFVAQWCKKLGVAHAKLKVTVTPPKANVQAWAREQRYRLFMEWCRKNESHLLMTAHHYDDQAETFLLRLSRGSGVDGLAAMQARTALKNLTILRPLLAFSKGRLIATLEQAGVPWIHDPSNDSAEYLRNRVRQYLPQFSEIGITSERLNQTARHLHRARQALESRTDQVMKKAADADDQGCVRLYPRHLCAESYEISLRIVRNIVLSVGGGVYPPRFESLDTLVKALLNDRLNGGRTLSGCRILPTPKRFAKQRDEILFVREMAAIEAEVPLRSAGHFIWDDRWSVSCESGFPDNQGLRLGALGRNGISAVRARGFSFDDADIPGVVRPTLPAVWRGNTLVAAPTLDVWCDPSVLAADHLSVQLQALLVGHDSI